jgi:putative PIN family toxin of toxin-antitoxin system
LIKAVIDTNIWISFLIGKVLENLIDLLISGSIHILTTDDQIEELVEVVKRPKFKKYFSEGDVEELLFLLDYLAEKVTVVEKIEICRDKNDNFIIDIGLNEKADYIVTGDSDLIDLKCVKEIKIFRYNEFEELIENIMRKEYT